MKETNIVNLMNNVAAFDRIKDIPKIVALNFTGKHQCCGLFLIKLQV